MNLLFCICIWYELIYILLPVVLAFSIILLVLLIDLTLQRNYSYFKFCFFGFHLVILKIVYWRVVERPC